MDRGDVFFISVTIVILFLCAAAIYRVKCYAVDTNIIIVENCTLLNRDIKYLTKPGFTVKKYVTTWDCGKYGCLSTDDHKVFRFGKNESTLVLAGYSDDTMWIDDIIVHE